MGGPYYKPFPYIYVIMCSMFGLDFPLADSTSVAFGDFIYILYGSGGNTVSILFYVLNLIFSTPVLGDVETEFQRLTPYFWFRQINWIEHEWWTTKPQVRKFNLVTSINSKYQYLSIIRNGILKGYTILSRSRYSTGLIVMLFSQVGNWKFNTLACASEICASGDELVPISCSMSLWAGCFWQPTVYEGERLTQSTKRSEHNAHFG